MFFVSLVVEFEQLAMVIYGSRFGLADCILLFGGRVEFCFDKVFCSLYSDVWKFGVFFGTCFCSIIVSIWRIVSSLSILWTI